MDRPNKVLIIRDASFILPEDFNGTLHDALELFLQYEVSVNRNDDKKITQENMLTSLGTLLVSDGNFKACAEIGVFTWEDGKGYTRDDIQ